MGIADLFRQVFSNLTEQISNSSRELEERSKLKSIESQIFRNKEEMTSTHQDLLNDALLPDEEYQMTLTLQSGGGVNIPHLHLTNQRLIKVEKTLTASNTESYDLNSVSQFDINEGLAKSNITISGAGIDEEFEVESITGLDLDKFQQAVYQHK
jgi:hypothetical protein